MAIKCPFCTQKEIEAKGCAHKLLTLKTTFPSEIIQDLFEEQIITDEEKKKGMVIFTAMHEERTGKIYPFDEYKSQLSSEFILIHSDFYYGFLNLLKKAPVLFFNLINLGKEIFCEHMKIIGKNVFTDNEKFKEITEEKNYVEKIDNLLRLISKTRRVLEEVEENFYL